MHVQQGPSIPVVISFDSKFIVPAATFLHSLLQSKNNSTFIDLYVLIDDNSFIESEFTALNSIILSHNAKITYIRVSEYFAAIPIPPNYPKAIFHRLLIHIFLPNHKKAIYFDVDIIVKKDITIMYDIDITGLHLAAIKEFPQDTNYYSRLGTALHSYFNSGVLVLNLEKLRMDSLEITFLNLAKTGSYWFPDQDILNISLANSIKLISPLYNYIVPRYMNRYRHDNRICSEQQMLKESILIHYTSAKPWHDKLVPQAGRWWKHYRICRKLLPEQIVSLFEVSIKHSNLEKRAISIGYVLSLFRIMFRRLRINEFRDYLKYRVLK